MSNSAVERLQRENTILKRQGMLLTGQLINLENSANAVVDSLGLARNVFYRGSAIYLPSHEYPEELIVAHVENPEATSKDHRDYVERNLRRRRYPRGMISAGHAHELGRTDVSTSRQVKGHKCLNHVFDIHSGALRGQKGVFQLVFDQALGSVSDAETRDMSAVIKQASMPEEALGMSLTALMNHFGMDLASKMSANPPMQPNAFLLFADITGYTKMTQEEAAAFDFAASVQERIEMVALKRGAQFFRDEGDGFWLGYGIRPSDPKMQWRLPLDIAQDIHKEYQELRHGDPSPAIAHSFLKICIAAGHITERRIGPPFKSKSRYDSLAHSVIRQMEAAAPIDRSCTLLTPETYDLFTERGILVPVKEQRIPVESTFVPEALEYAS